MKITGLFMYDRSQKWYLVDDKTSTKYVSASGSVHWVMVDLEQLWPVHEIEVTPVVDGLPTILNIEVFCSVLGLVSGQVFCPDSRMELCLVFGQELLY